MSFIQKVYHYFLTYLNLASLLYETSASHLKVQWDTQNPSQFTPLLSSSSDWTIKTDQEYANYLCFTVSVQFNNLNPEYNTRKYSPEQETLHELIKSLHDEGFGYREIAETLTERGLKTPNGKRWKQNNVYSVLKRHRERAERLGRRNRRYRPTISRMRLEYD